MIKNVLVTGATGYIGGRLVPQLLEAGYNVRCLVRNPNKLNGAPWSKKVQLVSGDLSNEDDLLSAMDGIDAAYYLVHSMGASEDFVNQDRTMATLFAASAEKCGLQRIIYLGGLGRDDDPKLSKHLRSRHEVGNILASGSVPVTELRAAIIIGSGSASFEMLRYLVEVLPAMITPKWVNNKCQPIAVTDVMHYLVSVLETDATAGRVLEIGGPEQLTYREMMRIFAECAELPKRIIVSVPVLTPYLSSLWIGLVTPLPTGLARPLVESLINEVIVSDRPITDCIDHDCLPFRDAVNRALSSTTDLAVLTRWSDASLPGQSSADPLPNDPEWAGGTLLTNTQVISTNATAEQLFRTASGLGGKRGWYAYNWLWRLRGLVDKIIGGVGMRRGRRHPDNIRVGDALDFWRVDAIEPGKLLRLRAEMKLPGQAWIEWTISDDQSGSGATLTQRALFIPKGLFGRLYWYSLGPFHFLIFKRLAHRIVEQSL